MAAAYPGIAFGFSHESLAAIGGVAAGGAQVVVTSALESQGVLGTPVLPSAFATNGELVNGVLGVVATGVGIYEAMSHRHPTGGIFALTYGLSSAIGGWLIPLLLRTFGISTGAFLAQRGAGPIPPPQVPGQANQQFIGGFVGQAGAPSTSTADSRTNNAAFIRGLTSW